MANAMSNEQPRNVTVVEVDKNGFVMEQESDIYVICSELARIAVEYTQAYPAEADNIILPLYRLWYEK